MALPDRRSVTRQLSWSMVKAEVNGEQTVSLRITDQELITSVHVGILSKYVNLGKGWKPRLFVLEGSTLKYYKVYGPSAVNVGRVITAVSKGRQVQTIGAQTSLQARLSDNIDREPAAQGEIDLKAAKIKESHTDNKKFYIQCGNKSLCCRAETREDRTAWLQALQTAQAVEVTRTASLSAEEPIDQITEGLQTALQDLLTQLELAGVSQKLLGDVQQLFLQQQLLYQGLQKYVTTLEDDKRELETRIVTAPVLRAGLSTTDEADANSGDQTSDTLMDDDETLTEEFVDCMEQDFSEEDFSPKISRSSSSPRSPCSPWNRMALASDIATTIKANGALFKQGSHQVHSDSVSRVNSLTATFSNMNTGLPTPAPVRTPHSMQQPGSSGSPPLPKLPSWLSREPIVLRRTHLPTPEQAEKPVGLWGLIRECVGKDLTRICLPVYFNEPLSVLQKCCEELEYSELLDQAVSKPAGSIDRMVLVAAFAVSGYSSTLGRTAKPFNPLLGETYELVCPEKKFRFLAEKVVHHPMVVACCAEGVGWVMEADAEMKSKFWGRSIELTPVGVMRVTFSDGDVYQWNKITSSVNNIVIGKIYVDLCGLMRVRNMTNHMVAKITFKEQSMFEKHGQQVRGHIEDADGQHLGVAFHGAWSKDLWAEYPDRKDCVWVKAPPPPNPTRYNLTTFAIQLNEMTKGLEGKIAPTDCRLRPDQRMLELGVYDQSNKEKQRLEVKQRAARKAAEEGEPIKPRWFAPIQDAQQGKEPIFRYQGGYWESREKGSYSGCRDIYGN